MLLAVDIGNTNVKFGIFDGEKLLSKLSLPTNTIFTSEVLASLPGEAKPISSAIVCSVVPEKSSELKRALHESFGIDAFIVNNDLDFGLKISYEPLSSLGTDRLVNAFAAVTKYGSPCIICSIGTATTFDVVDVHRTFLGGVIVPGIKTMAKALHRNTAQLPEVEIEKPKTLLGKSTLESIRSGIFYGQLAMVEWMIHKLRKETDGEPKVIATGGYASMIANNTTIIDTIDENLLLEGLVLLHERIHPA
jgi:type III pantothenate kinase